MKKYIFIPVLVLGGSVCAFLLRLMEIRTGFESTTGLPVPGSIWRCLLVTLLILLAVILLLMGSRLPDEKAAPPAAFTSAFSTVNAGRLILPVAGVFLLGLSGVLELTVIFRGQSTSPRTSLLMAVTALLSALSLFPTIAACHRPGSHQAAPDTPRTFNGNFLLVPVVCLVVRLVFTYRMDSINPALACYYVELLAAACLTLAFYKLAAFDFKAGRTVQFVQYASMAVILCCATLADGHTLSGTLLYLGCALTLMGFILLRLDALSKPRNSH